MSVIARLVSARIRELREARGWTQGELARRAGTHRPLIARAERGIHELTLGFLIRIAAALEVPITTILEVLDERKTPAGGRWIVHWEPTPGASEEAAPS